jgi:hypothetical protein
MARKHKPVIQFITTSRYKFQPDDRRFVPPANSGAWKLLLLVFLMGALTVGQLLDFGTTFPTLVDFLNATPQ